ncbi:MAG: AarF/ABC1/UbiB kinase family protein [Opitutales bacterium]|nr:AarF/ABC1/UbiB kinase family protein [Opitutales bacterium]
MRPFTLLRDAGRAREILAILVRYGFSNLLEQMGVPKPLVRAMTSREVAAMSTWQRLRHAIEDLGPTFVKLGQVLSTRPDRVPQALVEELGNLRDQVKPEPIEDILAILEAELGCSKDNHFSEFEVVPIGSGSIAQVHRATLRSTGELVAVKIQRPNIEKAIHADLEILAWMAKETHERVPSLRPYNLPEIVEALHESLRLEMDFSNEARNAALFCLRNPHGPQVFAPRVYEDYTSRRILVTELVHGTSPDRVVLPAERKRELARLGADSIFDQIIRSGFFHADPHPGNIIVTPDGRICFIDWGIAGQLTRKMRFRLAELLDAVVHLDPERVARIAVAMNETGRRPDEERLEMQVTHVFNRYGDFRLSQIGHIIVDLIYALGQNGVRIPRAYTMLARAVISIETTGRKLDPEFDIGAAARPFILSLARERTRPRSVARHLMWSLGSNLQKINELPGDFQRIFRRLERDDLGINLHHRDLEPFGNDVQKSANRLSLAVILGASIIGSSIVITTGIKPLIGGYPAIGLVGYTFSGLLGMWVALDILRHGRHK